MVFLPVIYYSNNRSVPPFHFNIGDEIKVGNSPKANLLIKAGNLDSIHFIIKSDRENFFIINDPNVSEVKLANNKTGRKVVSDKIQPLGEGGPGFIRQDLVFDDVISVTTGKDKYLLIFRADAAVLFEYSRLLVKLLSAFQADFGFIDVLDPETGKTVDYIKQVHTISGAKTSNSDFENARKIKDSFFKAGENYSFGIAAKADISVKFPDHEAYSFLFAPIYSADEKLRGTIYLHREKISREDFTQIDFKYASSEARSAYALYENTILKNERDAARKIIKDLRFMSTCIRSELKPYKEDIISGVAIETQESKELRQLIYFFRYFADIDIFCDFRLEKFFDKIISIFNADLGIVSLKDVNTEQFVTTARRAGKIPAELSAERFDDSLIDEAREARDKNNPIFREFDRSFFNKKGYSEKEIYSAMVLPIDYEKGNGIEGLIYLQRDKTAFNFMSSEHALLVQLIKYYKYFLKVVTSKEKFNYISSSFSTLFDEAANVLENPQLGENRIFDIALKTLEKIIPNFYMAAFAVEFEGKMSLFYMAPEGIDSSGVIRVLSQKDAKWNDISASTQVFSSRELPSAGFNGHLYPRNLPLKGAFSNFDRMLHITTINAPLSENEQALIKILEDEMTIALEKYYALMSPNKNAAEKTLSEAVEAMKIGVLIYNSKHVVEYSNKEFKRLKLIPPPSAKTTRSYLRSLDPKIQELCESALNSDRHPVHGMLIDKKSGSYSMSAVELEKRSKDGQRRGLLLISPITEKLFHLRATKHDYLNSIFRSCGELIKNAGPSRSISTVEIQNIARENFHTFMHAFESLCLPNGLSVNEIMLNSIRPERVSAAEIVKIIKSTSALFYMTDKKLELESDNKIDLTNVYVMADILAAERLFINIFKNCIDHVKGPAIQKVVINRSGSQNGRLKIVTADNGKGLPKDILDKLRTDNFDLSNDQAHGYGIFIARTIARIMTGEKLRINDKSDHIAGFNTIYGFDLKIVN